MLDALLWFLPAGVANMMPVVAQRVFGPGRPVSMRFLGSHKTWQGLVFGVLGGSVTGWLQGSLLTGVVLGVGALVGDTVESLVKRRRGFSPGEPWVPWDQLDYVLGGLLFGSLLLRWPFIEMLVVILVYAGLTIVVNHLAAYLKFRRSSW